MFQQKRPTSNEALTGMNAQKPKKKDSSSDQLPTPLLLNSNFLITLDNADGHSESTVNDGRDHGSEFAVAASRPMLTTIEAGNIASDEVDLEITGDEDSDPYGEVFEPPRPNSREIAAIDLLGLPFELVRDNLHHDCRNRTRSHEQLPAQETFSGRPIRTRSQRPVHQRFRSVAIFFRTFLNIPSSLSPIQG